MTYFEGGGKNLKHVWPSWPQMWTSYCSLTCLSVFSVIFSCSIEFQYCSSILISANVSHCEDLLNCLFNLLPMFVSMTIFGQTFSGLECTHKTALCLYAVSHSSLCCLFSFCSDETYVIGFVVPNQKHFLALANQYGVRGVFEELCNSKAMEELALKVITEAALAGRKSSGYVEASDFIVMELFFLRVTSLCLIFCCSPAGEVWDPSQDPPESRPVDPRDRISDWCVQAQT